VLTLEDQIKRIDGVADVKVEEPLAHVTVTTYSEVTTRAVRELLRGTAIHPRFVFDVPDGDEVLLEIPELEASESAS